MISDRRHRNAPFALVVAGLFAGLAVSSTAGASGGWLDPCRDHDPDRSASILELYEARDMATLWVTRTGTNAAGEHLLDRLQATADQTDAGTLMTACLRRGLDRERNDTSPGQLDVLLTDAYLALVRKQSGSNVGPRESLEPLQRARNSQDLAAVVASTLAGDHAAPADQTASREAPGPAGLDAAIERYQRIRADGGWPTIGDGPEIAPGMRDERVPAVRERLYATGDLASISGEPDVPVVSDKLTVAIERFQRRHGLQPTRTVDRATREAMNVPVAARIEQLRINRERMREHEPGDDGLFVRVNIPDFRVELHQQRRIVYTSRAVVGRPDRQTPVLDDRITHLTLNPAWNVPQRIVREDLAPQFARDPDYAERHGYELNAADRDITSVDWNDPSYVPLRQRPGPANALGQVKFEMPNERAIFLHDTPERHLFHADQRAFSAGCVRVEEPLELASRLAGYGAGGVQHLAAAIRDGETRAVRFGRTVPVQLVYFTAWADEQGNVQFREDIYDKDGQALARIDDEPD